MRYFLFGLKQLHKIHKAEQKFAKKVIYFSGFMC